MATSRTPASVLQEFCVHRGITPVYEIDDDRSPTHIKKFICKVTCDNLTAIGEGRSKKEAKHAAAEKMLQQIQSPNVPSPYEGKVKEDAVGPLSEFCAEYGIKAPEYLHTRAEGPPHATMFTFRCSVESFSVEAIERTKQQAKQQAARQMLTRLRKMVDARIKIQPPGVSFADPSQIEDFKKAQSLLSTCDYNDCKKFYPGDLTKPLMRDFLGNTLTEDTEIHEEIIAFSSDYNRENALETLTAILEKLELKYTLIPLESDPTSPTSCTIILHIDCAPNLSIHETGNTYVEACHNVAFKALQFIRVLYQRINDDQEMQSEIADFESLINCKKKSS